MVIFGFRALGLRADCRCSRFHPQEIDLCGNMACIIVFKLPVVGSKQLHRGHFRCPSQIRSSTVFCCWRLTGRRNAVASSARRRIPIGTTALTVAAAGCYNRPKISMFSSLKERTRPFGSAGRDGFVGGVKTDLGWLHRRKTRLETVDQPVLAHGGAILNAIHDLYSSVFGATPSPTRFLHPATMQPALAAEIPHGAAAIQAKQFCLLLL